MADAIPQAPRGLRGWFGKLRRKRWFVLFAFEFLVVVLGVLVAQSLATYFERASEERRASDTIDALRVELELLDIEVEKRRRSYLCTVFRLELMQKRLNDGQVAIPHRMYHPPEGSLITFTGWDSSTVSSMRRFLEPEEIVGIVRVGELAEELSRLQLIEREAWNDLHRLSEDLGEPSDADRSAAKGGLVSGKLAIGAILQTASQIENNLEVLGVQADYNGLIAYRDRPESCDQVVGYDVETQNDQLRRTGRLVTGQRIDSYYPHSQEAAQNRQQK